MNQQFHLGSQNDTLYIIKGRAPGSNDYPNHEADRTAVATVLDADLARELVNRANGTPPAALPPMPSPGLLVSMAIRYDHGLGNPGYYDQLAAMGFNIGRPHRQRLLSTITTMRQVYEEASGNGFYRPELEASYASRLGEAGLGALARQVVTPEVLQISVEAAALELVRRAEKCGIVVTIEHRRAPNALPGQHVVEARLTRDLYEPIMRAQAAATAQVAA